ncbi:MAG: acyl-CoA/acyl-ACP dehydrogenase [Alphaproteobacteria bacterium]|nr:acyl-CoA/acyl-ACP dehydrogenase [Alphaproteobacteria bacterium]
MDFALTPEQEAIRDNVARLCTGFDADYWRARDRDGSFPEDFARAVAEAGWLGIAMPTEFGGAGLGVTEAALMLHAIARSGAAMSGVSAVHINIFGPHPIVVFGREEQKRRMLPPLIRGEERCCFAVTEPDAGLDTTRLATRAVRRGDRYVVNGRKIWTSTAQVADKIMLIARTTPLEDCARPTEGLTLFYTDLDRTTVEVREIDKMGRHCVDSNELFIDDLEIPVEDRIGEEGEGFRCLLHSLNPERILVGAEAVGIGRAALERATRYASERVVFGRPIGKNQGLQFPMADVYAKLKVAELMVYKGAWLYDRGEACGEEANIAKLRAANAGFEACDVALQVHGGMGYAKEYHIERLWREVRLYKIAPVSNEMALNYIGEHVLGLPKSY